MNVLLVVVRRTYDMVQRDGFIITEKRSYNNVKRGAVVERNNNSRKKLIFAVLHSIMQYNS